MKKQLQTNEYTWSAKYYDQLCNSNAVENDIDFYKSYINEQSTVLELGCGTGRVGVEISKLCKKYVGIDLSKEMLEIFKLKIEEKKHNIKLKHANMVSFDENTKFDLIIFPFRSFQALTDNSQREQCLKNCKNHLSKNGLIIIQMFDPMFDMLDKFNTINSHDNTLIDDSLKIERHTIGNYHDKEKQIISATYLFKVFRNEELVNSIEEPLLLGYLTREQGIDLFNNNGFKEVEVFKWWDKSSIDNEKRELIYILQE